jgi:predicted nucleotidyltransferase
MNYGLSKDTVDKIVKTFKQFPEIESAIIYGSRAKGNYKPSSDIDISLKGKHLSLSILSEIINQLDDLLLPYKIDISIYDQINNPELLDHITRIGGNLYQAEPV